MSDTNASPYLVLPKSSRLISNIFPNIDDDAIEGSGALLFILLLALAITLHHVVVCTKRRISRVEIPYLDQVVDILIAIIIWAQP